MPSIRMFLSMQLTHASCGVPETGLSLMNPQLREPTSEFCSRIPKQTTAGTARRTDLIPDGEHARRRAARATPRTDSNLGRRLLQSRQSFGNLDSMSVSPGRDFADVAVLDGGPLDRTEHPVEWDTEQLCVIMTDGQQHRYLRTERIQVLPDSRSALVFEYGGRYFGPK